MVDILGIGASGLSAYRKLLETVGGNITNATTDGYVRRDVQLNVAGDSSMMPTSAPSTSGSGVVVDSVRRASDAFLQSQSLKANSLNMQSQTLADSLTQLERTLFASSRNPGSVVQEFYNRFADVANSPTSAASRISVVDSGKQVANMFAQTAASIQDSLGSARAGLDAALTAVNGITSQLARLNVQIQSASTSGQKANDLLDQRDKLLNNLSNLANFNYVEQTTGAVTVYLGDTASGRPIVSADDSHPLGIIESGDKLEIAMDPFSQPSPTNQLTSGTVAGLMDFQAQAKSLLEDINRLAVGLTIAVNQQHTQGVDLNGEQGGALFSTDGLTATGSKTNLGDAKLMLSIDSAASLSNATYTVKFNESDKTWTVKSSNGRSVTGQNNLSLGGVNFTFDGAAHDQDTFTVSPLFGAASSMRFLLKTPDEVAVALPLYVDPSSTNAGTGELLPLKRTNADPTPTPPSAIDIFDSANPIVPFLPNGKFYLPAGTETASLNSLGKLSAVHFYKSGTEIAALTKPFNGVSSLTLSLKVGTTDIKTSLFLRGSNISDIADAINVAAVQNGNGDKYFASVTNGVLSINALGATTIADGKLLGAGSDLSEKQKILGKNEALKAPPNMRIFTREGRQLFGPKLDTAQEIKDLLTTANGFLPDAEYVPPDDNAGYPRVSIETADPLLKLVESKSTTATETTTTTTIDVATQPSFNMPQYGYTDPLEKKEIAEAGAVYAMNVGGLSPVRVAGDSLAGAGPADIAAALADQLNAQAGRYAWLGAPIKFTDDMSPTIKFQLSIDGKAPHTITFTRSTDANNLLKEAGTFDLGGATDLQVSLVDGGRVMVTIPQRLRTTIPTFAITRELNPPRGYETLGFNNEKPVIATLSSPSDLGATLLTQTKPTLKVAFADNVEHNLVINGPFGTSDGVTWSYSDGYLSLSSSDSSLRVVTGALGFTTGQTGSKIAASTKTADALLLSKPIDLEIEKSIGDSVQPYTLHIDGPSGKSNDVSWNVNADGRLVFTSVTAIRIKGQNAADRRAAQSLGFNGADLDLRVESTIASADPLTRSILAGKLPRLQIKGDRIGTQVLTIDRTNGTFNGVTWSVSPEGKLQLSSADPSLRVDAGTPSTSTMAKALGFTGAEPQGSPLVAAEEFLPELLKDKGGIEISVTDDTGVRNLMINDLSGVDANSGISWSYDAQRDKLILSSTSSVFEVKVNSVKSAENARSLGFRGDGFDRAVANARIRLTSTVTKEVGVTRTLVDTSATVSKVGQSLSFNGGIPEDLIVAVTNTSDGSKLIAADVQTNLTAPRIPPLQDLQIKIVDSTHLEIFDPSTGVSLANRTWRQDLPITYQGLSFSIHGNAKTGDIFTVRNDGTRSSDNRNALLMANLALTSIFGKGQGSFQDVYAGVTAKLGSSVEASSNSATAAAQAASDLKSAYDAKTGVNLDREAADLIRFQQAYQASAQIIMAARDMFSTILRSF